MDLNEDENHLLEVLQSLHAKLRDFTYNKYQRINPFYEDLFEWQERGKYWTGKDGVTIYNSTTVVGDVDIGSDTWIGPFSSIDGTGGLKIGSHCSISSGVQILTHDTVKWALSGGIEPYEFQSVTIGDCCFLGTQAVVTKGVTIGNHCLIAAGAVVTKNFPDFSIIAGVPGKTIGSVQITEKGKIYFKFNQKSER